MKYSIVSLIVSLIPSITAYTCNFRCQTDPPITLEINETADCFDLKIKCVLRNIVTFPLYDSLTKGTCGRYMCGSTCFDQKIQR